MMRPLIAPGISRRVSRGRLHKLHFVAFRVFHCKPLAAGEPEPGYDEWFRASVEEALADDSAGIPHEEAMEERPA